MHRIIPGLILVVAAITAAPRVAGADDPSAVDEPPQVEQDDAEIFVEAPGTRIAVDRDEGAVDIRAGDARIYADDSWGLDIRAPGITIRARPQ